MADTGAPWEGGRGAAEALGQDHPGEEHGADRVEGAEHGRDGQRPCDLEGPVYDANFPWNATQMMRQCRLRAWQFRHRAIYSDEASASRAVSFTTWICHKG